MYNILCKVSGGTTGSRQALLKSKGAVIEFHTQGQAERRASELTRIANGNKYRTADYSYTAQPA